MLEVFWAQLLVISLVYFGTGVLSALGLWLVSLAKTAEPLWHKPLDVGAAYATLVNLGQWWLLLLALMAAVTSTKITKASTLKKGTGRFNWVRMFVSGFWVVAVYGFAIVALWSVLPLVFRGFPWAPILAQGTRSGLMAIHGACCGDANPFNVMQPLSDEGLAAFWPFGVIAWAVPALFAICSVAVLARNGSGRAHPSYKQEVPGKARLPSRGDIAAEIVT